MDGAIELLSLDGMLEECAQKLLPKRDRFLESVMLAASSELRRLHRENRQLRRRLLDMFLEADLRQEIKPPAEWEDYPFLDN